MSWLVRPTTDILPNISTVISFSYYNIKNEDPNAKLQDPHHFFVNCVLQLFEHIFVLTYVKCEMRMIFTKLYVIILLGYIDPRESVLHVDQMMSIYDRMIKPRFFCNENAWENL